MVTLNLGERCWPTDDEPYWPKSDPLGLNRWCDYEEMDEYPSIMPGLFADDSVGKWDFPVGTRVMIAAGKYSDGRPMGRDSFGTVVEGRDQEGRVMIKWGHLCDPVPAPTWHPDNPDFLRVVKGVSIRYEGELDEKGILTYDTETSGPTGPIAFFVPQFKQTGTFIGRLSSKDPNGNKSNQPRDKFDFEQELAKLTPEEQKLVRDIVAEYNNHTHKVSDGPTAPPVAKFIPTKDNCGCSGHDLLHSGHKCGFFKN